jgi:hypothetical protein
VEITFHRVWNCVFRPTRLPTHIAKYSGSLGLGAIPMWSPGSMAPSSPGPSITRLLSEWAPCCLTFSARPHQTLSLSYFL